MSHKSRSRVRTLLAVPSAAVLVLGASQALASPAPAARIPDCETYCMTQASYCTAHPTAYYCVWCGCGSIEP